MDFLIRWIVFFMFQFASYMIGVLAFNSSHNISFSLAITVFFSGLLTLVAHLALTSVLGR